MAVLHDIKKAFIILPKYLTNSNPSLEGLSRHVSSLQTPESNPGPHPLLITLSSSESTKQYRFLKYF